MLWSIAAGPLVNVLLVPALTMGLVLGRAAGLAQSMPDGFALLRQVCFINYALLIFNMLPIYPLDGGQILRSLLCFPLGRARSLMVASIIGFIGVAALILLAIVTRSYWTGIMAVFILLNCWGGLMQARALTKAGRIPRRSGFACPVCSEAPPVGQLWGCGKCRTRFDTFETGGVCPNCGAAYGVTTCPSCGSSRPIQEWSGVRETAG